MILSAEEFHQFGSYWAVEELSSTICKELINLFMDLEVSYPEDGELEFYKVGKAVGCKIYCRGTLVREFIDDNPNVTCYFEEPFFINEKRMERVQEALKEILTNNGKKPGHSWVEEEILQALSCEITAEIDKEIVASISNQMEDTYNTMAVPEKLMKSSVILTRETCKDIDRLMKATSIQTAENWEDVIKLVKQLGLN